MLGRALLSLVFFPSKESLICFLKVWVEFGLSNLLHQKASLAVVPVGDLGLIQILLLPSFFFIHPLYCLAFFELMIEVLLAVFKQLMFSVAGVIFPVTCQSIVIST
ncbi:hypothetical protein SLEP1_g11797 [Rubroshorea leprosula]|nr:hypothetical protein SLEP1_g11797 [Rubroshorea leprosula]